MRLKDLWRNTQYLFQKLFRKDHISDIEIFNCRECLAKYILPRLKALRNQEFFCYPNDVNSISLSRTVARDNNEYDKEQIAEWQKKLDEMIFAFEYSLFGDSSDKKETEFYTKYFGEDPYEKFNNDFDAGTLDFKNDNVDYEVVTEAHKRALKGFKLFGEYFLFLYD